MKLFTCTDHDTYWPVGVASIIVAEHEGAARQLLDTELKRKGLHTSDSKPFTLKEIDLAIPQAIVLCDGDY